MQTNTALLKLLAVFLIIGTLVFSFYFARNSNRSQVDRTPINLAIFPTPTPTTPPVTNTKVSSGDGSVNAILSQKKTTEDTTYTLSTSDQTTTHDIFTQTLALSSSVTIPPNTWSPDNKLFFIIENSGAGDRYYIYKFSGQSFGSENFLDVTNFWTLSKINLSIHAITGWAGNNLLQIQTNKSDGSRGQNYWFNTDTHSFLPLSS